jgi:glycosidase
MLAEASKPELMRSAFNLDYAWPLLHTFESVIMRGEPATALRETMERQRAMFPKGTMHMHVIDDHDELRAVTQFSYPGAIAAAVVMLTLDGVPLIYNGMEAGDSTQSRSPALFEPQKIFWEAAEWHPEFPKFYAAMDALRRQHPALQQGELRWTRNSDEQHVVTYIRHSGSEEFLIAVNLSNTPFRGTVEAEAKDWRPIAIPLSDTGTSALPFIALDAFQFRIFQSRR